ncbi:MAG TPA: GNAT family protein [Streptosporangiaceae bacterium]|jgi:RimJ/RimL family protein N-acetyltransferase
MVGQVLTGRYVRLEPLGYEHVDGLAAASEVDPVLYRWSPVPQGHDEVTRYVETALSWRDAGTAVPYATVRVADGVVIGCTRFWGLEFLPWPPGHDRHDRRDQQGRALPDAGEIGYTWLTRDAVRTAANTEAKLLMLTLAFEDWQMLRVCFHTNVHNERSRAALSRIGGQFEGILRTHRLAPDLSVRDSARFSIVAAEWPQVKERLTELAQPRTASR